MNLAPELVRPGDQLPFERHHTERPTEVTQGLIIPRPPRRDGKEINCLSTSLKVLLPVKVGNRCTRIICSNGENKSPIASYQAIMFWIKMSISPKVHESGRNMQNVAV